MKVLFNILITILTLLYFVYNKVIFKHLPSVLKKQQRKWNRLDKAGKVNHPDIWVVSHKPNLMGWDDLLKAPVTLGLVAAGMPVAQLYTVKGGRLNPVIHWVKEIKDMVSLRTFEYISLHEMGHIHHKHLLKMELDTKSSAQVVLANEYEADQFAIEQIANMIKVERGRFSLKLTSPREEAKVRYKKALTDYVGALESFYGHQDLQGVLADRISHL